MMIAREIYTFVPVTATFSHFQGYRIFFVKDSYFFSVLIVRFEIMSVDWTLICSSCFVPEFSNENVPDWSAQVWILHEACCRRICHPYICLCHCHFGRNGYMMWNWTWNTCSQLLLVTLLRKTDSVVILNLFVLKLSTFNSNQLWKCIVLHSQRIYIHRHAVIPLIDRYLTFQGQVLTTEVIIISQPLETETTP